MRYACESSAVGKAVLISTQSFKKKKRKNKVLVYCYRYPPTCTCVLLKLVSPVHHLFMPLGAVLPFPASSFRFHLTDVKCAPEPGDC